MKLNIKLFSDILKEKIDNELIYSQGRVYLLVSIVVYYLTIGLMTARSLKTLNLNVDLDSLKTIIEALQWAILLFAGYVFGGKGLDVIKVLFASKNGNATTPSNNNTAVATPTEG